ncbi:MAG: aldo/keto reductase [Chloroflexi bacterium]|nr:aldo/keto reductase [Chloroflexota bacterium]
MRYRELGKTGFRVSEIGFGAWGIGGDWWKGADDEESTLSLKQALDLGVNFVDTAMNYGNGHSEQLVGKVLGDWPGQVYVASKIPPKNYSWPAAPGTPLRDTFPKEWIVECTERSLKYLGRERIDLQQFHVWLDEWAPLDEWKEAVSQLKQQGKVGAFGLSLNFPLAPDYGAQAIETGLIDACQVVYNIYEREPERALFSFASQKNVGILVRSPLDEGALSGKITPETVFPEGSFQASYFKDDRRKEVWERAKALEFLLHGDVASLPEAAIRFCLSNQTVSTVLVGMRKTEHTRANLAASGKGPLPKEDLARLEAHVWPHNFWA